MGHQFFLHAQKINIYIYIWLGRSRKYLRCRHPMQGLVLYRGHPIRWSLRFPRSQNRCDWMQLGYLGDQQCLQRMVPDSRVSEHPSNSSHLEMVVSTGRQDHLDPRWSRMRSHKCSWRQLFRSLTWWNRWLSELDHEYQQGLWFWVADGWWLLQVAS